MRQTRVFKTLILGLLQFSANLSYAWDGYGHRVVGAIADRYLTPAAREEADPLVILRRRIG